MKTARHSILLTITTLFLCLIGFTSCDEMDHNGAFEGYWLLTEREGYEEPEVNGIRPITLPEGGTAATDIDVNTTDIITWGVRNSLIVVKDLRADGQYYFTFTRDDKKLQLHEAYFNDGSNDTKMELSEIPTRFCIPENGHFSISQLDSKTMVLNGDTYTLRFKKN